MFILCIALNCPSLVILSNAFSQSRNTNIVFVSVCHAWCSVLHMIRNASAAPLFFLKPYCVCCKYLSIRSAFLCWRIAAMILYMLFNNEMGL